MECQVLSTDWARQFQKLSGLEVMHHATAWATARETNNVGQWAWKVVYSTSSALRVGQPQDKKHEETVQQLHAEADKVWKDANDLVFQHQLCYDEQLTAFISDTERTIQEKQNEVWGHICQLADMAGIPHNAFLGQALQVLEKLPIIPIDLTYYTPMPMMLAYTPKSYAYQT